MYIHYFCSQLSFQELYFTCKASTNLFEKMFNILFVLKHLFYNKKN